MASVLSPPVHPASANLSLSAKRKREDVNETNHTGTTNGYSVEAMSTDSHSMINDLLDALKV